MPVHGILPHLRTMHAMSMAIKENGRFASPLNLSEFHAFASKSDHVYSLCNSMMATAVFSDAFAGYKIEDALNDLAQACSLGNQNNDQLVPPRMPLQLRIKPAHM